MPGFYQRYGTEAQCRAALEAARWPTGFACPACGGTARTCFERGGLRYWQCGACAHQCSLISGTIFEASKLPLTRWFLAMQLLTQAKNNVSALELMRQLGVSYRTAWLVKHKIMDAMRRREADRELDGRVEMDDAYLGGERSGGKVGRGSENKVPIVAAVQCGVPELTVGVLCRRRWVGGLELSPPRRDRVHSRNPLQPYRPVSGHILVSHCFSSVLVLGPTSCLGMLGIRSGSSATRPNARNPNFGECELKKLSALVLAAGLTLLPVSYASAYVVDVYDVNVGSIVSLAQADAIIAAGPVTASGNASTINFDDLGDGTTGLFGGDTAWPGAAITTFAARVTGNFSIGTAGTYTFGINHDDGARLRIDGVLTATADGLADNRDTTITSFFAAGIHTVEIVFFENGGGASLEYYGRQGTGPNSLVQSVPEPATLALVGLSLLGVGFSRRKSA